MQLYSIAIKIFREQQDEDNALDRMALFFFNQISALQTLFAYESIFIAITVKI